MSERAVAVEELLDFPTAFAFKAVGPSSPGFVAAVAAAVRGALEPGRAIEQRSRASGHGTYCSVTLTTRVEHADELRAVYRALRAVPAVITVL